MGVPLLHYATAGVLGQVGHRGHISPIQLTIGHQAQVEMPEAEVGQKHDFIIPYFLEFT